MGFYDNNQPIEDGALSWDSEIEKESSFELLPEGTYDFTVTNLERDRYDGGEKLSACPMAILTLNVKNQETGETGEIDNIRLFLHTKTESILSAFFLAIGQKKEGEKLKPNWGAVIGAKGSCEVEINKYTSSKNGKEYQNNQIKSWIAKTAKQSVQAPQQQSWTGGKF